MLNNLEFRAWDLRSQQMHRVKTIDFLSQSIECLGLKITDCNILLGYKEFVLMQNIGLKSHNNVDLFIGDIVDCYRCNDKIPYRIVIDDIKNLQSELFGSNLNKRELAGNIYENPELLNT